MTIDSNISFQFQVNNLCKKDYALARVASYLNLRQEKNDNERII